MLIAERFNLDGGVRWPRYDQMLAEGRCETWLEISYRLSCYQRRCGPSIKKLEAAGLRWPWRCANLLPPAPCGEWDAGLAEVVGEHLVEWLLRRGERRALLLGTRVARAVCGYRAELLSEHECEELRLLVFPHPSGQNRWWNDAENWELAREAVEEFTR